MKQLAIIVIALVILSSCASNRVQEVKNSYTSNQPISIQAILADPQKYFNKEVVVSGMMENKGNNYFTDLRVVLKESDEIFIDLKNIRFPLGAFNKDSVEGPTQLSDLLGKKVLVSGTLEKGTIRRVGQVYFIDVKSISTKD